METPVHKNQSRMGPLLVTATAPAVPVAQVVIQAITLMITKHLCTSQKRRSTKNNLRISRWPKKIRRRSILERERTRRVASMTNFTRTRKSLTRIFHQLLEPMKTKELIMLYTREMKLYSKSEN